MIGAFTIEDAESALVWAAVQEQRIAGNSFGWLDRMWHKGRASAFEEALDMVRAATGDQRRPDGRDSNDEEGEARNGNHHQPTDDSA